MGTDFDYLPYMPYTFRHWQTGGLVIPPVSYSDTSDRFIILVSNRGSWDFEKIAIASDKLLLALEANVKDYNFRKLGGCISSHIKQLEDSLIATCKEPEYGLYDVTGHNMNLILSIRTEIEYVLKKDVQQYKERYEQGSEAYYALKAKYDALKAKINAEKPKATQRERAGHIYLLQSEGGAYKIGRTKNPSNRLKTFSVKLPFQVEFEHLIQTDDMYELERELHNRYASKRVRGEWFALSQSDIDYIKSL